jgi:hypothetical protein
MFLLPVMMTVLVGVTMGQWFPGFGGGSQGYFGARQRTSRFAAYGGPFQSRRGLFPNDYQRQQSFNKQEQWPENKFFNPFNNRLQILPSTTTPRTATTTTRTTPRTTSRITTQRPTTSRPRVSVTPEQFSRVFEQTEKNPYLSIDTKRFPVLAAVPGSAILENQANEDVTGLSQALVIDPTKEVSEDVVHIPEEFSPVPAVPDVSTHSNRHEVRGDEIAMSDDLNDDTLVNNEAHNDVVINNASSILRKQFKRCHGKCVQKFCLPVEEIPVYESCSNKCKGICSQ